MNSKSASPGCLIRPWLLIAFIFAWLATQSVWAVNSAAQRMFSDGYELLKAGKAKEASAKFESGLRLDPKNALAYFYLGEAYNAQSKADQARKAYYQSLAIDPNSSVAAKAQERVAGLAGGVGQLPQPGSQSNNSRRLYTEAMLEVLVRDQTAHGNPDTAAVRTAATDELVARALLLREAQKNGMKLNLPTLNLADTTTDQSALNNAEAYIAAQTVAVFAYIRAYLESHPVSDADVQREYDSVKARLGNTGATVPSFDEVRKGMQDRLLQAHIKELRNKNGF